LLCLPSSDVEFCGYSIPHPSEPKMNIRIQMYGEYIGAEDWMDSRLIIFAEGVAFDALEKGLNDLEALCDVVVEKFIVARESFPKPTTS
jgi:DNA-directed RNA polymerase I and III subunit RPAC2